MLIPLELSILSRKKGYVSPELALGWRVGNYIREFFTDLQDICISTTLVNDAALALKWMTDKTLVSGQITITKEKGQWDFLVYHPVTGTVLKVVPYRNLTELPVYLKFFEGDLSSLDDSLVSVYRDAVNDLIVNILHFPIEVLCQVSEHRCRRIIIPEQAWSDKKQCPRCGKKIQNTDIWDVDGIICCLSCSGLEPSWFVYH